MQAGRLNRRVTIQQLGVGRDAIGQVVPGTWTDVASVWADIRNLAGLESIKANAEVSTVRASIRIRRRDGITAAMRVVHLSDNYEIKAVLPDEQSRDHIDLVCELN